MASAEYHREWRRKNPEKVKAKKLQYRSRPGTREREAAYEARRRLHNPARLTVEAYKAAPCTDCNTRYPALVMEFDHLDPTTKLADISVMVRERRPLSIIFAEIAKCDLVCANCHRIRTLNRKLELQLTRG